MAGVQECWASHNIVNDPLVAPCHFSREIWRSWEMAMGTCSCLYRYDGNIAATECWINLCMDWRVGFENMECRWYCRHTWERTAIRSCAFRLCLLDVCLDYQSYHIMFVWFCKSWFKKQKSTKIHVYLYIFCYFHMLLIELKMEKLLPRYLI